MYAMNSCMHVRLYVFKCRGFCSGQGRFQEENQSLDRLDHLPAFQKWRRCLQELFESNTAVQGMICERMVKWKLYKFNVFTMKKLCYEFSILNLDSRWLAKLG